MASAKPSEENRKIARHVAAAFGGTPSVREYRHDTEPLAMPVLACPDSPYEGVTSYSTLGLSDCPMVDANGAEFPARLELAGACATATELFANLIASAGFIIQRTRKPHYPGAVLDGLVREYFPTTTVPHLYCTAPFLWGDAPATLDCGTKKVSWLLVVPISHEELSFLLEHGDDALENLFEKEQIDIFDLNRPSVA